MKNTLKNQRGIGHVGVIVAIVVIAAAVFVGWWVWKNNNNNETSTTENSIQDAIKNAKCDYDDQDLCKFFTGWKAQQNYEYAGTTTQSDGSKSVTTVKGEGDDKFYMKLDSSVDYEIIQIGNDLYTKAADGTWWKQTLPENETDTYKDENATDFTEPTTEATGDQITYKQIGKEKCGDLTCFKYQVIDPGDTATTTYIWFDDKDYQLRRMQTTSANYSFDATYKYGDVNVSAPSPVKELGANQYLVPGQSEPTTLPDTGDMPTEEELQQLMQQYQ